MADTIKSLQIENAALRKKLEKYEPAGFKSKNLRLQETHDGSVVVRYTEKSEGEWYILKFKTDGTVAFFDGIYTSKVFKTNKRGIVNVVKETPTF